MAVSVRIEDEAFSDVRYEMLARAAGLVDADHARGKMARIWRQCTQQHTHVLPAPVVVAILGDAGPDALITSGLGEKHQRGVRIKGTKGRIEWLDELRKSASAGGKARAAAASRTGGKFTSQSAGERLVKPTSGQPAVSSAPSPSPSPVPAQEEQRESTEPAPPAPSAAPRPRSRKRGLVLSESEATSVAGVLERLSREAGVEYRATSDTHASVIAGRLRQGVTEDEMRAIVVHCAHPEPGGLGWRDNPKMRPFLRPETLFGPTTIERYLPAARKLLAELRTS